MQGDGALRRVFPEHCLTPAYGSHKASGDDFPVKTRIKLSALYFAMHFGADEFSLASSAL
ncbi:hypothetical protein D8I24_7135 [Cupriavidus necator H850]|jgi:hypothetical protein|nr:hypothetical protein D8I24_7135 [Cupriavidus necator H850]